ncbi:MAG: DUF166 family protein [Anaerolineales bacterium]
MRILAVISGDYGLRHVNNIRAHGPAKWKIETWKAPAILPPVIDYPEDYLPDSLPTADLILSFGEHTESGYNISRRQRIEFEDPLIAEFARYFGQPELDISVDASTRLINAVNVRRDAVCGCASYAAERLVGVSADEAEEKAGLLHHHYPCLASMGIDSDYGDTLMHVSGNILKDKVGVQVKPFKKVNYIAPGKRSE